MDDLRSLLVCCALVPALVAGCATQTESADTAPSAGLDDLGQPTPTSSDSRGPGGLSLAEAARRAADDMAALMNNEPAGKDKGPTGRRSAPNGEPAEGQRPWQMGETDEGSPPAPEADPGQPDEQAQLPTAEPEQPVADADVDVAPPPDPVAMILERLEIDTRDPERALAASILAQAIREYASADDGSRPGQNLSPPERELATLLGPLLDALTTGDRADAPNRIGLAIDDAARGLSSVLPVRINDAALATDIYGFAAYKPFESYTFLSGRSNRMLVYTEPANFQSRLATEPASQGSAANPGAYEVVLGLELQLYNERGSMLAWRRPEERVAIRSDRPRSEVYLGTMIELPDRLSVGRYQLKVVLRDHADGSEDERVIPIKIVADPRLTTRTTRSP